MYVTLEQAKKHLVIDESFHDDDLYILDLITVAEDNVSAHLDIPLCELEDCTGMLPASIIHAILLQIGTFYEHRASITELNVKELPLGLHFLLSPYKNYSIA